MRRLILLLILLAAGTATALAAGDTGSPWYWGAGLGAYRPDGVGARTAWGLVGRGGYDLPWGSGFSVEGELGASVSKGKWAYRDLSVRHAAAYAVWRSPGDVYLKLRAGGLYEHVSVGDGGATDNGGSIGIGGGWATQYGRFEAEYTVIENHIDMVSITWQP